MKTVQTFFEAFVQLFFPNLCPSCGQHLLNNQKLCFDCDSNLPRTNFHLQKENSVTEKFYGRIEIENGSALFWFIKSGRVQQLIHQLKYRGNADIGIHMGYLHGEILSESEDYRAADLIIPVPLHPKKEKQRGYNQSDMIAQGLSQSMTIPWQRDIIVRTEYTSSQTNKSNVERFENVKMAFSVIQPDLIKNKHILLVDDVLTTGATLEACISKLLEVEGCKVSVTVLAIAES